MKVQDLKLNDTPTQVDCKLSKVLGSYYGQGIRKSTKNYSLDITEIEKFDCTNMPNPFIDVRYYTTFPSGKDGFFTVRFWKDGDSFNQNRNSVSGVLIS